MFQGILNLPSMADLTISKVSIFELFRTPFAVNLALLGVPLVWLTPQRYVRPALTWLSIALLLLFLGIPFTAGVLVGCSIVYLLSRALGEWARRSGDSRWPILTGWVVINAMFLPCFFLVLPAFGARMEWGEVTQFWGISFLALKSLHYMGQVCRARLDMSEPQTFGRFWIYMLHIPSFRLGPYQPYRQLIYEIDTCRDRLNLRNLGIGALRICSGVAKHVILFNWIQRPFFYSNGFYGPFATPMVEDAAHFTIVGAWCMSLIWVVRFYLFMSGFSDSVIGMNLMMGIRVPENFRYPFLATSMIDLWRRWHCSVAEWLRDEIFIPLGGERQRWRNYFLTFAYCGFWHWPLLWPTMVLFPLLQVVVFALTHAWQKFWHPRRRAGSPLYVWARRLQLVDSIPARLAGTSMAIVVFMLSCLLLFDHRSSGLPMMSRMIGLPSPAHIADTNSLPHTETLTR